MLCTQYGTSMNITGSWEPIQRVTNYLYKEITSTQLTHILTYFREAENEIPQFLVRNINMLCMWTEEKVSWNFHKIPFSHIISSAQKLTPSGKPQNKVCVLKQTARTEFYLQCDPCSSPWIECSVVVPVVVMSIISSSELNDTLRICCPFSSWGERK